MGIYAFKPGAKWAEEVFLLYLFAWLAEAVFLVGAARRRGEAVPLLAFVPVLQKLELARAAGLPLIAGVLLALGLMALRFVDYFYGPVSMVHFAALWVIIPAYLYVWKRITDRHRLSPWIFFVLFAPFLTAQLGYLLLGLAWLAGARPFERQSGRMPA